MSSISGIKKAVVRKMGKITGKKTVAAKKEKKETRDDVESRTGSSKIFSSVRKVKPRDVAPRADRLPLVQLEAIAAPKRMHPPIEVPVQAYYETFPEMPAAPEEPEGMAAPLVVRFHLDPRTADEYWLLGALNTLAEEFVNSEQHLVIKDAGNGKEVKFGVAVNDEEGRAKACQFLRNRARYCEREEDVVTLAQSKLDRQALKSFLKPQR